MSTPNPYAAPKAALADATQPLDGDFILVGEARPAGHGWSWIAEGWALFKRQPGLWIGITLLAVVIFIAGSMLPLAGLLLPTLFWPVFLAGIAIGCRTLDQGHDLELAHLFAGFQHKLGPLVAVGALTAAASLVIMLVVFLPMGIGVFTLASQADPSAIAAMGLTLLVAMLIMFALFIPVMMAAWFAPLLVAFHEIGAWEAMTMSFSGCLKNVVPFLVYGLALFLLMIPATLLLGLGWLVLWPVLVASIYTSYRDIYFRPRQ